jgi:transcriptional regulator with XRE-family HTH domain
MSPSNRDTVSPHRLVLHVEINLWISRLHRLSLHAVNPQPGQLPGHSPDEVARMIRSRRHHLDWSLARLASASGLRSPAYIFHIENGSKTPSEPVARRIAEALGLDPELLAAWAQARGRVGLQVALDAAETLRRWRAGEGARAPAGESDAAISGMVEVPLLPEGADPAAGPLFARAIETLRLDRALLPPLSADAVLVGYRLSAHGARRIPEALRPGDGVVVLLGADPPGPDTPCAMRVGGRIEITRLRAHEGAAHLPPSGGANDSWESGARPAPAGAGSIAGRVVLVFRRWL